MAAAQCRTAAELGSSRCFSRRTGTPRHRCRTRAQARQRERSVDRSWASTARRCTTSSSATRSSTECASGSRRLDGVTPPGNVSASTVSQSGLAARHPSSRASAHRRLPGLGGVLGARSCSLQALQFPGQPAVNFRSSQQMTQRCRIVRIQPRSNLQIPALLRAADADDRSFDAAPAPESRFRSSSCAMRSG